MAIQKNIAQRLLRVEKMAEHARSEQMDVIEKAYADACESGDEELAAYTARAIRNRKLADSDAHMMFDRMNIDIPTGSTFASWLQFLRDFAGMMGGDMAKYRAALRNMPEQEGFPFDIKWPEMPGSSNDVTDEVAGEDAIDVE